MPQSTTPQEQLTTWIPLPPWMKEKLHVDGNTLSAELTVSHARITFETRFIQTSIKAASSIKWAKRRIEGLTVRGLGPAIAARIEEAELVQLIRTVSADRRGNILLAP